MSQGLQATSSGQKRQGNALSTKASERTRPGCHLDLSPTEGIWNIHPAVRSQAWAGVRFCVVVYGNCWKPKSPEFAVQPLHVGRLREEDQLVPGTPG